LIASCHEEKLPAYNYTLGKVYYAMNRYEEALECYQKALNSETQNTKYHQKALANMASTKVMAANYKEAFAFLN